MKIIRNLPMVFAASVLGLVVVAASTADARPCTPDQQVLAEAIYAEVDLVCPCDGEYKNHGRYVRCVARTSNQLFKENPELARSCKRIGRKCAARSTCGKDGAVRCCLERERRCEDDPAPGNLIAEGTCAKIDGACDTNADCVEVRCKISRFQEKCEAKGGIPNGTGSCCGGCVLP